MRVTCCFGRQTLVSGFSASGWKIAIPALGLVSLPLLLCHWALLGGLRGLRVARATSESWTAQLEWSTTAESLGSWEGGQEGTLSESLLPTTTTKEKGEEMGWGGGIRCGLAFTYHFVNGISSGFSNSLIMATGTKRGFFLSAVGITCGDAATWTRSRMIHNWCCPHAGNLDILRIYKHKSLSLVQWVLIPRNV